MKPLADARTNVAPAAAGEQKERSSGAIKMTQNNMVQYGQKPGTDGLTTVLGISGKYV